MAWNLYAAVDYLIKNSKPKSNGQCAKYVREAIEAGGISTAGRPVSAYKYKDFLPNIGFKPIGSIFGKKNQANWTKNNARRGDIAVMDHGKHGHICMYSGYQWISDFKQNNMWVYGGDGICYIFRFNGEIDPTLDSYISFSSSGLVYNVPLEEQEDHQLVKNIANVRYNLINSIFDFFGETKEIPIEAEIEYDNEISMDDSSISESIVEGGMFLGSINSDFAGAEGGKLQIPQGFYSDQILYEFITHAEGSIGIQWVSTFKGHDIVRSAACFGYDFPGGVHDPSFISKLGLTQSDADSLGISNNGRKPIGAESYGGKVQWGWYTNPIPGGHPYWKKLIPYYRDAMIWAWNQPGIQAIKSPGERLARMHTINWYGYHFMKGLTLNDVGFKHRLQIANQYTTGMRNFI